MVGVADSFPLGGNFGPFSRAEFKVDPFHQGFLCHAVVLLGYEDRTRGHQVVQPQADPWLPSLSHFERQKPLGFDCFMLNMTQVQEKRQP